MKFGLAVRTGPAMVVGATRLPFLCPGLVINVRCRWHTCQSTVSRFCPPLCYNTHTIKPSLYLRGSVLGVPGGPVTLRRADGVRDAAVIFSRRLVAVGVRPPRRVAFLNGARLLETPAAQQISHLKKCNPAVSTLANKMYLQF